MDTADWIFLGFLAVVACALAVAIGWAIRHDNEIERRNQACASSCSPQVYLIHDGCWCLVDKDTYKRALK